MKEKVRRLPSNYLRVFSVLVFLFLSFLGIAQTTVLVTDSDSNPLIGVQVFVNDKAIDATDINGEVDLVNKVTAEDKVTFTYLSYQTLDIRYKEIISQAMKVVLSPDNTTIDEVLIIGRNEKVKSGVLLQAEIIGAQEIAELEAQTPADLLEKNGSVFIQKSQMGGGSPVIRGFEANKILLVLDGVRLNNAIYRSGHLQNAITIDEMVLQQAEVLFGPGSIIYGSDAIGGVLHFRSKTGRLTEELSFKPSFSARTASANSEKTVHANLEIGNTNYSGIFGYTLSSYGDLRSGKNRDDRYPDFGKRPDFVVIENGIDVLRTNEEEELQIGTAYTQQDFFSKVRYVPNEKIDVNLNMQYSTSTDVPRYDALTERQGNGLRFAEWYYGPQDRVLVSLNTKIKGDGIFDELYIINSYQKIDEDRYSRGFGDAVLEENKEDLHVLGSSVDMSKDLTANLNMRMGAEFQYNDLTSTAGQNQFTRYPSGDNSMLLAGLYAKSGYTITSNTDWQLGVRYSYSVTKLLYERNSFFEWPDYFYEGIENRNNNLSFLTSMSHSIDKIRLYANAGTSFRAPNIDDLAKTRVNTNEISVPNPELKPEKSWNAEIGAAYASDKITIRINTFYTSLRDAIVRENFMLIDGSTTYRIDEEDLNVVSNVNAAKARVYGVSLNTKIKLFDYLNFRADASAIEGEAFNEEDVRSPLGHIPPMYGKAELIFNKNKFKTRAAYRFNAAKKLEDFGGSVDNPELATLEGSLAWNTWNLYCSYKIFDKYSVNLAVENILDVHYRTFSSGVSAAGRNLILSVRGTL